MSEKHLWECNHAYYCNESNYTSQEPVGKHYKSFADFIEEWGDADIDCNLLFRWDWVEEDSEGEPNYTGDDNYRNGVLKVFWMLQRKGHYVFQTIDVCRADEQNVIAFLKPRLQHLKSLWEPL